MSPQIRNTYVDKEIARLVMAMQDQQVDSKEYGDNLDKLSKLQKIRQEEKPPLPSPDTLFKVAANLIGIYMIVRHENLNVITSKALSFVGRA